MRGCRPLSVDEVGLVLGALGCERDRCLFALGISTGLRISELLSVDVGDVVCDDGGIGDSVEIKRRAVKGKKSGRIIRLNGYARGALGRWLRVLQGDWGGVHGDCPVFCSRGFERIGRVYAWQVLKRAYGRAGLNGKLATHTMRKTFANRVYEYFLAKQAGGEAVDAFRLTSRALGHAAITSTDKYLSFRTEDVDGAIDALSDVYGSGSGGGGC